MRVGYELLDSGLFKKCSKNARPNCQYFLVSGGTKVAHYNCKGLLFSVQTSVLLRLIIVLGFRKLKIIYLSSAMLVLVSVVCLAVTFNKYPSLF